MAMAEISRAPRRGFSSTEINENALIIRGHALLEENAAGVGAMYLHVADGASLILICLVMERWRPARREIHGSEWHCRQRLFTLLRVSKPGLVDPCGTWHMVQPSVLIGGCS